MARRNVALAQRQDTANKRRSRGRKRRASGEVAPASAPVPAFDDLTEAFFATAPADDGAPAAAPDTFDDLVAIGPPRRDPFAGLRRALAAVRAAFGRWLAPASPQRATRK